ncbi:bifunctional phosphoribosyl-AMP cyclohydrolase/phosphoribosyl-ATP diphosphatase HisIE [Acetatifactor muris]|uniref:Histidine biosynthesis bifunctional protein HisIE n=1 Tax=Acetatifactor muris TaxID=879566 RepID=A0A2K4ZM51_9FIRM|nr:bifunctional phosphoribosyl-AMP cyclohydrolase/phosphoribosyl-ATP diphosphatase HisIE [Acetatifactor muris]MCR2049778.1 bifunctional phosphoribosyl-AMP cyclohydrolase/phosphoribosyl-ATP diphosphatase HisIE [Acetatifactor muris]SOY31548.1 Phosphoribosyl-ATP pyrophosphatase [Acetatifactor muris]
MIVKKFVPCIYLYNGHAVRRLNDPSVVETDPLRLVRFYNENNADGLIVFDMSDTDEAHEEALDVIKEICGAAEMDVIGAGNIRRMEDVKKLLYAGCRKAILDYSRESNVAVTEEVSLKFGRDKILASYRTVEEISGRKELLEKYVSALLLLNPHQIRETEKITELPFFVEVNQIALNKLMEIFAYKNVCGVTGNTINDNYRDIPALKNLCKENNILVETFEAAFQWADFRKNSDGLVPVIVQDYRTGEVLMMAYMDEEAYQETIGSGRMHYYSRSRRTLWLKGETSGHFQYVKSLAADCDMDTILAKVSQVGAACHTGARSCFFNEITRKEYEETNNPLQVLGEVLDIIRDRKIHPKEGSYTNYLFEKGLDKILKKLGEEATEIVIAAKNPNANEVKYEMSDFLYHMMVLMAEKDISWEELAAELANR